MILSNPDLEKKLLAGLLQNTSFLETRLAMLDSNYFVFPEHQTLFSVLQQYFTLYRGTLSEDILVQYLERGNVELEKHFRYIELFREVKSLVVETSELRYVVDELKDLKLRRDLRKITTELDSSLDSTESSAKLLSKLDQTLVDLKKTDFNYRIVRRHIEESVDERQQQYLLRKSGIKPQSFLFGFKELDDISEGMQRDEFGIVVARTGVGKSRFLFNVGYNMAKQGYKVMYVSLEMPVHQIERLYDSRAANISSFRLKKGILNPEEEVKYLDYLEKSRTVKGPKSFYIVDIPGKCSVEMIERELDDYEKIYGQPVDVLIIDYLTIMLVEEKSQNMSVQYGNLSKRLKELARIRHIPVLTASQSNRQSVQSEQTGTEHISYSDAISWNSDIILSLSQSKVEKVQNILTCRVIKYRDMSNIDFKLFANFDHSYIGDSVVTPPKVTSF